MELCADMENLISTFLDLFIVEPWVVLGIEFTDVSQIQQSLFFFKDTKLEKENTQL